MQKILDKNTVGLYALNQQQFVLEDVVGITHHFNLLIGAVRKYKDKNKIWFVFQGCSNQINQEYLITNVGSLEINYSYFVNVTNDPQSIKLDQVELAGIESNEQLNLKIKQDFNQVFNQNIYQQQEYQELNNLIQSFLFNCQILNNSLGTLMEQAIKLEIVRFSIDQINHKLSTFNAEFNLYGGLYHINTRIGKISLEPELKQRLQTLEITLRDSINKDYERTKDERKVALELINNIGKWDGLLPSQDMMNIVSLVVQNIIPSSVKNNHPEFESTLWEKIPKIVFPKHNQANFNSVSNLSQESVNDHLNSMGNNLNQSEEKSFKESLAEERSQQSNNSFNTTMWHHSE